MKKVLLAMVAVFGLAASSFAATPIQLSLWDRIAIPVSDTVYGLEIGIGSNLAEFKGVQWNIIWSETERGLGWQSGLLTKVNGEFTGLQTGFVSLNGGTVKGVKFGFVNFDDSVKGASFGFVNYTKSFTGFQLGLFNYVESAESFVLQIGLVNYLGNSSIIEWFPFINAKF